MSRKPISVVKSRLHQNCSAIIQPPNATHSPNDTTWCSWPPFDQDNYKELLGAVDNAFLVAYAIGMFISGIFGERLPLRYYLSAGMLLSGLFTSLFGLGYFWDIHVLWYFVLIQICNGLVQTTGWPSVVTCVGNWFGKGRRGLIMGIWNSHTSVGNILGSLIAGIWVSERWGLSFVVPGVITAAMGIVTFFFLIEYPEDVDCTTPQHHGESEEKQDSPEDPGNNPYCHQESSLEAATGCSKEPSAQPAAISFWGALMIPGVIEFSLCLLFAKLVSYTFLYWLPLYIFNVGEFRGEAVRKGALVREETVARGLIMGIWNSHTSVGNILGSLIAGIWVSERWGLSFVVPGVITAAMGIVTFFFLIEYPEDVDCTTPQHHGESEEKQDSPEDPGNNPYCHQESSLEAATGCSKEPSAQPAAISFWGALMIPGVIEFSLCLLFAKLVSYTFLYWLPLYIFNVAHFSAKEAGDLSTLFDVGGITGGILAGLISDYTNGRATTCCVMLILAAPMLFLYNHFGQSGIASSIVMLIICGALVNGPYALITTAVSADLGTHQSLKGNSKALSTVTAIIDGTGSIGAALGPLLAGLISPTGWNNVFYMLISADILACLLLCRLVYKEILACKSHLSPGTGSCLALTHTQ
ncbi:PREDICTED: sugar phosphate exchanger 2 [Myotis brandtii]|uniref:sugar phosphate exchanger 2 n=1 Tax=Myotis brandtii TaxID=109478 RepID=UPI000703CBDC|nr:PREDICTED: sugar phosphate exchanger 2 [Myotis brandtii]